MRPRSADEIGDILVHLYLYKKNTSTTYRVPDLKALQILSEDTSFGMSTVNIFEVHL